MRLLSLYLFWTVTTCAFTAQASDPTMEKAGTITSGKSYSGQWLVILGSFKNSTDLPDKLSALNKLPNLAARVARIRSSEFKNLMPCYEVVIAGGYDNKKQARKVWKQLKKIGVISYFKDAGKWVGKQPRTEAYCQKRAEGKVHNDCAGLHWVERWQDGTFLALPRDEVLFKKLSEKAAQARPLKGDLTVWISPLNNKVVGDYRAGDKWTVYGQSSSEELAACSIKGFALLTRGMPHFGWLQQYEGKKRKPKKPACGEPALFAELACIGGHTSQAFMAAPKDKKQPIVYALAERTPVHEPLLISMLGKGTAYEQARTKAVAEAEKQGQKLIEKWSSSVYQNGQVRIGLLSLVLMTGEGMTECGAEDLRLELVGAAELDETGKPSKKIQELREKEQSVIHNLVDPDGSGKLRLFESLFPSTQRLSPLDGGDSCEISQQFCDCPC